MEKVGITSRNEFRPGVILWAHGRSATDTFALMMNKNAHFKYCNNIKESFIDEQQPLDFEALVKCIEKKNSSSHM